MITDKSKAAIPNRPSKVQMYRSFITHLLSFRFRMDELSDQIASKRKSLNFKSKDHYKPLPKLLQSGLVISVQDLAI